MIIKKDYYISGVVVTPANIWELANRINDEYKKDIENCNEGEKSRLRIAFILNSFDGTQYESQDITMLSADGILSTRKIISVEISYRVTFMDKSINVRLFHSSQKSRYNSVQIKGCDEVWTNGVLTSIKEIITTWKKQNPRYKKYRTPLVCFGAITIGWSLRSILYFIGETLRKITHINISVSNETLQLLKSTSPLLTLLDYAAYFGLGLFAITAALNKIDDLFPDVEFLTGPEHMQTESLKRKRLYKIITVVILPLLIAILIRIF
jgi:hypothetical protein